MTEADPGCTAFRDALVLTAVLTNDVFRVPSRCWATGGIGQVERLALVVSRACVSPYGDVPRVTPRPVARPLVWAHN